MGRPCSSSRGRSRWDGPVAPRKDSRLSAAKKIMPVKGSLAILDGCCDPMVPRSNAIRIALYLK